MWIWIALALLAVIVCAVIVGALLPPDFRAAGTCDVDLAPEPLWAALSDIERHPMAAKMARSVQVLPQEDGLPVWVEDLGSSKVRVRTTRAEPPTLLVRELADQVVPMTARVELRIEPRGGGSRVYLTNHTRVSRGTWHVPLFRLLLTITPGLRSGMRAWLQQAVPGRVRFDWRSPSPAPGGSPAPPDTTGGPP